MNDHDSDRLQRGTVRPDAVWLSARKGVRGKTYAIRWVDPISGKTKSQTCGADKALARRMQQEKCIELRRGVSSERTPRTVDDLVNALPGWMIGKAADTVSKTQQSLRALEAMQRKQAEDGKARPGPLMVDAIDRDLLMAFRAWRSATVSPATVNKDMRQIKSALSYAVDAKWISTNPLWRWKSMQLREPQKAVRVVEEAEFQKIIQSCENPAVRVMLLVAYDMGLRRREVCNLRWSAVDIDKGVIHVVNVPEAGEFTKSRKSRAVPMTGRVKANIEALAKDAPRIVSGGQQAMKYPHVFTWPGGRPFKPDWVTHAFAAMVKAAGIPHCTPHDLRRSFSTIMQRRGVDRSTVKDLGGWSATSVIEKHYTGDVSEALHAAMRKREAVG